MFLFRPTFVTATTTLSLVLLLCALVTPISAAPQFGRPLLHVLDESPVSLEQASATVVSSAGIVASTVVPAIIAEPPTPTIDRATQIPVNTVNVANEPSASPTTSTLSPSAGATWPPQTLAQSQTNGVPRRTSVGGVTLVLSVAVSAVFMLF